MGKKGDFNDETKFKVLKWRDHLGLPGWTLNEISSVLTRERQGEPLQMEEEKAL